MKRILISLLLLSPLSIMAMDQKSQPTNYTMPSTPNDARNIDVQLDWQITTEYSFSLLPVDDPKLLVAYYAIFKNCNNRTEYLEPDTQDYTKNLSGYTLAAKINSVAFEKHIGYSISFTYTTTKDGKSFESTDSWDFKHSLSAKNQIEKNLHMRLRLSEIKDDTQKKQ